MANIPETTQSLELEDSDLPTLSSLNLNDNLPQTEKYNHIKEQETARRTIAYTLLAMMAVIIIAAFAYLFSLPLSTNTKAYSDNLVLLLQVIFTPMITLTGTAVGYYFGANSQVKKD